MNTRLAVVGLWLVCASLVAAPASAQVYTGRIDVTIKDGKVTPTNEQLKAGVKQQIVIRVNSDAADELHVHSTPEHSFNVEAKPMQSFQFTVDVPGKVDVELHKLNQTIATIQVQ